jgi:hypothetical protein
MTVQIRLKDNNIHSVKQMEFYVRIVEFMHTAMTTILQQVPERDSLAADGPSVAANSRPRRAGILRLLVPHCFR